LVNELRELAFFVKSLPVVEASPDPYDNYLLSIAIGGRADYLVTGDKHDLLALKKHGGVAIVTVSDLLAIAET
jgi:predicted nucleic acid-binding protein